MSSRTGESNGERRIFSEAPGREPQSYAPRLPQATGKVLCGQSAAATSHRLLPVLDSVLHLPVGSARPSLPCLSEGDCVSGAQRRAELSTCLLNDGEGGPLRTGDGIRLLPDASCLLLNVTRTFDTFPRGAPSTQGCPSLEGETSPAAYSSGPSHPPE